MALILDLLLQIQEVARNKPNGWLVLVSYVCYHTSTPSLSTWSSSTILQGNLILGMAWRLDAFSAYPDRT